MAAVGIDTAWETPEAIQAWWDKPHQKNFHRSYDATMIARLRDPVNTSITGNAQALKLRAMLAEAKEKKTTYHALGATDTMSAHLLTEGGMKLLYVSGAASSQTDTSTNDVGADLADYPYDTVPRKVKQIFRSQLLHNRVDKTQTHLGTGQFVTDRFTPMIADGDSGHGSHSAVMKLTKLFVDAGVAGFHIDDLYSGVKRFGGRGTSEHTIVPLCEHIRRLAAAKMQLDIMGSEVVLIHRTDAETSPFITSNIDPRDRAFILGSTNPSLPHFVRAHKAGQDTYEWRDAAKLQTIDEAVKAGASSQVYERFVEATKGYTTSEALAYLASEKVDVYWSDDACRTAEGWYMYRAGIESATMRALECDKYADMLWSMSGAYQPDRVKYFAEKVQAALPGKLMTYNWSGPFEQTKPSDAELASYISDVGKMGFEFQMLPLAGPRGMSVGQLKFAKAVATEGLLGYSKAIREAATIGGVSVITWYQQMGAVADTMNFAVDKAED